MKRALVAVALAGCDKLLGFVEVKGVDAPPPDVPTQHISGDVQLWNIQNDVNFAPMPVTSTPAPGDLSFQATLPDGTPLPVTEGASGTFSFDAPIGSEYLLDIVRSVDPTPSVYRSSSATFAFRPIDPDRPGAVAAKQPTSVGFSVSTPLPTGTQISTWIASTGVRSFQKPDSGTTTDPVLDWSHNGYGLLSAAAHDMLHYQRWQVIGTNLYSQITDLYRISIDLVDGGSMMFAGPTSPVTRDRCVHVISHRSAELARLHQAALGTTQASGWLISSIPVPSLGPVGQLPIVVSFNALADDNLDVVYGTPYIGETDVVEAGASLSRSLQLPTSRMPITISDTLGYTVPFTPSASSSCPANQVQTDVLPIALLQSSMLAGAALAQDEQVVTLDRTQPVSFDYTLSADPHDETVVRLYEVVTVGIQPMTQTSLLAIRQYIMASPVQIDPALLAKNHYYIISVTTQVGFPGAPMLDYRAASLTTAAAQVWTAMFQIGN